MVDPSSNPGSMADTVGRACALILAVGVLVQGFLAGRHLGVGAGIDAHGIIGDTLFLVAVVVPVVALLRGHDGFRFGLGVAVAALVFAQIGLGYLGRESAGSRAWHITNGVLLATTTGIQAWLWWHDRVTGDRSA